MRMGTGGQGDRGTGGDKKSKIKSRPFLKVLEAGFVEKFIFSPHFSFIGCGKVLKKSNT